MRQPWTRENLEAHARDVLAFERGVLSDGEPVSGGSPTPGPGTILLVGEAPGKAPSKRVLASLDRRLSSLASVPRVNLLAEWPGSAGKGSRFPLAPARRAAKTLRAALPEASMILVGRRVAEAFGFDSSAYDFFEWFADRDGRPYAVIPHPSGISLWWNEPANRRAAEGFADEVARLLAPGARGE